MQRLIPLVLAAMLMATTAFARPPLKEAVDDTLPPAPDVSNLPSEGIQRATLWSWILNQCPSGSIEDCGFLAWAVRMIEAEMDKYH